MSNTPTSCGALKKRDVEGSEVESLRSAIGRKMAARRSDRLREPVTSAFSFVHSLATTCAE
eukprot:scaffold5673_cov166-Pinguiococcus_pyrenoidosus.AAC.2